MSRTLFKKQANLNELSKIAKQILSYLPKEAIIFLNGDLAAGKTTLVANIAKVLNLSAVTSPTFSLQQIYEDKFFHYDFYRVDFDEILQIGLLEEFEKEGLHFVEWGSGKLKDILSKAGFNLFEINILNLGDIREYELKALDES
jgi:tRNA threonylcarbamoyladenosine biosynthesis protein TsaE